MYISWHHVLLDTKPMSEAPKTAMDYSRVIIHPRFIHYFTLRQASTRSTGIKPPPSFLSPMFTSILAEMENVGNSLKCLGTKLALLKAKAICNARVASGIASVFVTWLRTVSRWNANWREAERKGEREPVREKWIQLTLNLTLSRYWTTPTLSPGEKMRHRSIARIHFHNNIRILLALVIRIICDGVKTLQL